MTLSEILDLINEKKALGSDPSRIEITDLAEVLFSFQNSLPLSSFTVSGTQGEGKVPKSIDGIVTWSDDLTATPGATATLDQTLSAGNTTNESIVFNETLVAPASNGDAVNKRWFKFDNLVKTTGETTYERVNFNWWQAATKQGEKINEVMHIGWNMGQGGGQEKGGIPAIGVSIESNFRDAGQRLVEMHDFYIDPAGRQHRLASYTVRTADFNLDFYHTVSRFYLKVPDIQNVQNEKSYFSVQPYTNGGQFALGSDIAGGKSFYFEAVEDAGGGLFFGVNGYTVKELYSQGFTAWNLPGLRISSSSGGRAANIKILGDLSSVVDLDTDDIVDFGVPSRRFKSAHIRQYQTQSKAGNPTSTEISSGYWGVWKNTSSGEVKVWVNDGGSLKSVTLS